MNAAEHKRLSEITTELLGAGTTKPMLDAALKSLNDFVTETAPGAPEGEKQDLGSPQSDSDFAPPDESPVLDPDGDAPSDVAPTEPEPPVETPTVPLTPSAE